ALPIYWRTWPRAGCGRWTSTWTSPTRGRWSCTARRDSASSAPTSSGRSRCRRPAARSGVGEGGRRVALLAREHQAGTVAVRVQARKDRRHVALLGGGEDLADGRVAAQLQIGRAHV